MQGRLDEAALCHTHIHTQTLPHSHKIPMVTAWRQNRLLACQPVRWQRSFAFDGPRPEPFNRLEPHVSYFIGNDPAWCPLPWRL